MLANHFGLKTYLLNKLRLIEMMILERELRRLITHHTVEIKRLSNSSELYKHENIALLKKELVLFINELNLIKG